MSRYFMYGTSLGGIEQLMMLVPNFPQRRSGIVINNYFNCQRGDRDCRMGVINIDDSCRDCISYNWNFKINLDKKRYNDLVIDCFDRIKNNFWRDRLKELGKSFNGEIFFNYQLEERFYNFLQEENWEIDDISSRFLAILFLLSADESLWRNSEKILKKNKIDLKNICLKDIETDIGDIYVSFWNYRDWFIKTGE